MSKSNYRKNNKPWNIIKDRLKKERRGNAKVGFLSDIYDDGTPVAQVAMLQNEGLGDFPSRPFFYEAMQKIRKSKNYHQTATTLIAAIAAGNMTKLKASQILGEFLKAELILTIDAWTYPPNSPTTIASKGRDDPLRDTFKMVDSVRVEYSKRRK